MIRSFLSSLRRLIGRLLGYERQVAALAVVDRALIASQQENERLRLMLGGVRGATLIGTPRAVMQAVQRTLDAVTPAGSHVVCTMGDGWLRVEVEFRAKAARRG